ncbi:hypothetical protein D3C76_1571610 [compost metagenome]
MNVTGIRVALVKDVAGNYLKDLTQTDDTLTVADAIVLDGVVSATATNVIEVPFNQDLQSGSATPTDFVVKAGSTELLVSNAVVDGKKVVLTLSDSNKLN